MLHVSVITAIMQKKYLQKHAKQGKVLILKEASSLKVSPC